MSDERKYYVYGLVVSGQIVPCYIGMGQGNRMHQHWKEAHRQRHRGINFAKYDFLSALAKAGTVVTPYKIAEHLTKTEAYAKEKELIAFYGRLDLGTGPLLNLDGGGSGSHNPGPATRQKISEASKRPENRARIAAAMRDPEVRARIGAAAKKRFESEEERAKVGAITKGRKHSAETKAHLSAVRFGKIQSEETRAKRIKTTNDPEHRARVAELARNASPEARRRHLEAMRSPEMRARAAATSRANITPERLAKMTEAQRSPEVRAKMSAVQKAMMTPERRARTSEITKLVWKKRREAELISYMLNN